MKKHVMLVLASAFIFSLAVSAQDQMPPQGERVPRKEMRQGNRQQQTPQIRAEHLAKQLNLTDAEKAKVQALFEKQNADRLKKQAERRAEVKKDRKEMKAQFEAERKAQDAELEKIIGAEKFKQLQAIRAERMEKMKQRNEKSPGQEEPTGVK